jgi:hypothetical protein
MSVGRRSRRRTDPLASFTIYRDHPEAGEAPELARVEAELRSLYPEETFSIERRAMVVDGESFVVFDVFRSSVEPSPPASKDRRRR